MSLGLVHNSLPRNTGSTAALLDSDSDSCADSEFGAVPVYAANPHVKLPAGVTAVPVQYMPMGSFPGMMYPSVGPPLFNAPPLMLPNVVFQHTVVPAPPHAPPKSSDGDKESENEAENAPHSAGNKVSG